MEGERKEEIKRELNIDELGYCRMWGTVNTDDDAGSVDDNVNGDGSRNNRCAIVFKIDIVQFFPMLKNLMVLMVMIM